MAQLSISVSIPSSVISVACWTWENRNELILTDNRLHFKIVARSRTIPATAQALLVSQTSGSMQHTSGYGGWGR
jgi:hypothetical protein